MDNFLHFMQRGGWVMWPLLALSVVAVTLAVERVWFFARLNAPGRGQANGRLSRALRKGDAEEARHLAQEDRTVYGDMVLRLLDEPASEAAANDAIESQRHRLERFIPTLSTIITAAPMLGILGTVLGIIASFQILATRTGAAGAVDPRSVSQGIAEALITTAAGLVIAVCTLFPYNALRAQIDRTLGRLESLAAAAMHLKGTDPAAGRATPQSSPRSSAVSAESTATSVDPPTPPSSSESMEGRT